MALNENGRIAIGATLLAGWSDFHAVWKPVMTLMAVGWLSVVLIGLIADWTGISRTSPDGATPYLLAGLYMALFLWGLGLYLLVLRLVLLGRETAFRIAPRTLALHTLRYIWKLLQFMLLAAAGAVVIALPVLMVGGIILGVYLGGEPGLETVSRTAGTFSRFIGLLVTLVVAAAQIRLTPAFYAVALGQKVTFREAWQSMQGNTWRVLIACLPAFAIFSFVEAARLAVLMPAMRRVGAGTPDTLDVVLAVGMGLAGLIALMTASGWVMGILAHVYRDLWPLPEHKDQTAA